MLEWTASDLIAEASLLFPRDPRLFGLDGGGEAGELLTELNRRLHGEPMLLNLNFRVEAGDKTLAWHPLEGPDPGERDEDFEVTCRVILGDFGPAIALVPFFPRIGPSQEEWIRRVETAVSAIPDYPLRHANVVPMYKPEGERVAAALAFFESEDGRRFARFYHPKRLSPGFMGLFFRKCWRDAMDAAG